MNDVNYYGNIGLPCAMMTWLDPSQRHRLPDGLRGVCAEVAELSVDMDADWDTQANFVLEEFAGYTALEGLELIGYLRAAEGADSDSELDRAIALSIEVVEDALDGKLDPLDIPAETVRRYQSLGGQ